MITKKGLKELYLKIFPDTALFGKIHRLLLLALIVYVVAIFLSQVGGIFNIPIDKPYFTGKWDEPFAINAGINTLMNQGDPVFYSYGGPSVYPYAFIYYHYGRQNRVCPVYKGMDKEFDSAVYPLFRKISPTKPIYMAKVAALLSYLAGSAVYTVMFLLLMFPAASLAIPSIEKSFIIREYSDQMLPQTAMGIMAGITALAFVKAIFEEDISKYYRWTLFCAAAASLTVANKINAVFIVFLPLSLVWRLIREKHLSMKRLGALASAFTLPYILANPAIIFNTKNYFLWCMSMFNPAQPDPNLLVTRSAKIQVFLKDIHVFELFTPVALIALFIAACIIFAKKNPAALSGILFFLAISFYSVTTMSHKVHPMHPRHYVFLVLPINIFFLYPFAYGYKKASRSIKAGATLVCLLATMSAYAPQQVFSEIIRLPGRTFTQQWPRESRDDLIDFVRENNAVIHFYDLHGFSLPDSIRHRLISFSSVSQLPEKLAASEYIAFIKYKSAAKIERNVNGQYNRTTDQLMGRFQVVRILGAPDGAHDLHNYAPLQNPTIVILKEK